MTVLFYKFRFLQKSLKVFIIITLDYNELILEYQLRFVNEHCKRTTCFVSLLIIEIWILQHRLTIHNVVYETSARNVPESKNYQNVVWTRSRIFKMGLTFFLNIYLDRLIFFRIKIRKLEPFRAMILMLQNHNKYLVFNESHN